MEASARASLGECKLEATRRTVHILLVIRRASTCPNPTSASHLRHHGLGSRADASASTQPRLRLPRPAHVHVPNAWRRRLRARRLPPHAGPVGSHSSVRVLARGWARDGQPGDQHLGAEVALWCVSSMLEAHPLTSKLLRRRPEGWYRHYLPHLHFHQPALGLRRARRHPRVLQVARVQLEQGAHQVNSHVD